MFTDNFFERAVGRHRRIRPIIGRSGSRFWTRPFDVYSL
jgi:hypothetical protein